MKTSCKLHNILFQKGQTCMHLHSLRNEIPNLSNNKIIAHQWDAFKKFAWHMLRVFTSPKHGLATATEALFAQKTKGWTIRPSSVP